MIQGLLDQLADVYVENVATGRYTTLLYSRIRCRMGHMPLNRIQNAGDRAEISAMRNLIFESSVHLPETCQIEVDGVRWAPKPGTFGDYRDWTSNGAYKRCDVLRQEVNSF